MVSASNLVRRLETRGGFLAGLVGLGFWTALALAVWAFRTSSFWPT